jgi:hypothetical protein
MAKATQAVVVSTPAAASKADKARAIFGEMFKQEPRPARKDMIARAVKEADLTPAGAATYLQNYKAKNNLVQRRVATA